MVKKLLIIIGIIAAALVIFVVSARLLTPEDDWICQDGKWVKHGNPGQVTPQKACPTTKPLW